MEAPLSTILKHATSKTAALVRYFLEWRVYTPPAKKILKKTVNLRILLNALQPYLIGTTTSISIARNNVVRSLLHT